MDTQALIADAVINGGGTYHGDRIEGGDIVWSRVDKEDGYYVAIAGGVENLPTLALVNGSLIEDVFYARHYESGLYFGLWQDEDLNWSIDEVEWYAGGVAAVAAGRMAAQRAIWDIKNNEEVVL